MFTRAIARIPGSTFAQGLTSVGQGVLGAPDLDRARAQHAAYCQALRHCGLTVEVLEEDPTHPDSTFVEDTAILVPGCAILTHPGAISRVGEVAAIRGAIARWFDQMVSIELPGTVDGGDICEADGHVFIGVSHRTNEEGARQLAAHLAVQGFTSAVVDIRDLDSILHLKSGLAYIGDHTLVLIPDLMDHPAFRGYTTILVEPQEAYAANCIRVNDHVLLPAGFPLLEASLARQGFHPLPVAMSEFQKMDGGPSCLSLRF